MSYDLVKDKRFVIGGNLFPVKRFLPLVGNLEGLYSPSARVSQGDQANGNKRYYPWC